MPASTVDRVSIMSPDLGLPLRIDLRPSHLTTAKYAVLALPALSAAIATLGLGLLLALDTPHAFDIFRDRPATLLPIVVGALLIALLAAYPTIQLFRRLGHRTEIEVDQTTLRIRRSSLTSITLRSEPMSNYRGIARRTRTSLTDSLFEIVLVPNIGPGNAKAPVLIAFDERTGPSAIDRLSQLLDLPVIDLSDNRRDNGAAAPAIMPRSQELPSQKLPKAA